ncbi:hypothetical protein [Salinactinospora qingdaonensis]|uniref:Immunity protein 35 n=1 Tax=Salinactinospora qingdaonensis TaxID=702744 RepID=A0ABP7GCW0_9ACTN
MTLEEHALEVMRREARRRGLNADFPDELPIYIPHETRRWVCDVADMGFCCFVARTPKEEITLPSERVFLPVNEVLAARWFVTGYGTVHIAPSA